MRRHHDRTFVPFPPAEMFALVAAVEDYPQFIPWIEALRVRARRPVAAGEVLTADMVVAYGPFRESFRSEVTLTPAVHRIDVAYVEGPLKTLTNNWQFQPEGEGCVIDFSIAFEFRSRMLQAVASQLMEKAFLRLSGAFVAEATRRHASHIEKQQSSS